MKESLRACVKDICDSIVELQGYARVGMTEQLGKRSRWRARVGMVLSKALPKSWQCEWRRQLDARFSEVELGVAQSVYDHLPILPRSPVVTSKRPALAAQSPSLLNQLKPPRR